MTAKPTPKSPPRSPGKDTPPITPPSPPGKDLPDPMPDRKPDPGKDIPDPMRDDKAGQTAINQRGGKAVRGWEDIDQHGHEKGHGDEPDERKGQKGH